MVKRVVPNYCLRAPIQAFSRSYYAGLLRNIIFWIVQDYLHFGSDAETLPRNES